MSAAMDSGVPQGTVLGPLLFLLHINDLPNVVDSQVRLFADDCFMYRPIRSVADQVLLQQDLSALERWGDTWGKRFNASKCNIMRISRARNPIKRFYSLCGQVLLEVDTAKYRGVNLSAELSWSPHVSGVCSKANSTLGFLRRNLKKCPPSLKETAYISLVRSTLEYAATIWDPHLSLDISSIEKIQRRVARFVKGDYNTFTGVTNILNELGWQQLVDRKRELVRTIVTHINICHRRRIQQSFSLLIGRFLPATPSLPPQQRLPLLSLLRLHSQAVPRGTRARTCTPTHPPIYSTKRTVDYLPRPDQRLFVCVSVCVSLFVAMFVRTT